jgi:hypothetical protein
MIITKIQGGLGNQMFQYAYGRYLSEKFEMQLLIDKKFYEQNLSPKRYFLLNYFDDIDLDFDFDSIPKDMKIFRIDDNFKFKELKNLDKNFGYYFFGYWQSEKYFIDSEKLIRNSFRAKPETVEKLSKISELNSNSVSLHIRRTDYLASNGYHPVQTIEYYKNALDLIGDYDNLFIFSDDIDWCKSNLNFKNMIFRENHSEIEDLFLMSYCKNNIIANSTFSWWGAWLNNNKDKKVIAPAKWFGTEANLNEENIIPASWIKI